MRSTHLRPFSTRSPSWRDNTMNRIECPVALLRELLTYDRRTGHLFWKRRDAKHFASDSSRDPESQAKQFNTAFAGKAAGGLSDDGYARLYINGRSYLAHRVIYALVTGKWPADEIDHENGVKGDNRWANIRPVDRLTNAKNLATRADNLSGITGVGWYPNTRKWRVRITDRGRTITVGSFASFEAACAARASAQAKLGFHPNHGRMAR